MVEIPFGLCPWPLSEGADVPAGSRGTHWLTGTMCWDIPWLGCAGPGCVPTHWELTSPKNAPEAIVQQIQVASAQLGWDAPLCPSMEANLFHAQLAKVV